MFKCLHEFFSGTVPDTSLYKISDLIQAIKILDVETTFVLTAVKKQARKLYSKVKETKKEFKPSVNICKAKDGSIICDQNEVLTRWNEHFDDLPNKNNNQEHTIAEDEEIQPIEGPSVEDTDHPTFEELEEAINPLAYYFL